VERKIVRLEKMTVQERQMLWAIAIVLIVLWGLGLVHGYPIAEVIHVLLIVALIGVAIRIYTERRAV
jgi:uncharacterized protein DUF5670